MLCYTQPAQRGGGTRTSRRTDTVDIFPTRFECVFSVLELELLPGLYMYAVFDGHSGSLCAESLVSTVAKNLVMCLKVETALGTSVKLLSFTLVSSVVLAQA